MPLLHPPTLDSFQAAGQGQCLQGQDVLQSFDRLLDQSQGQGPDNPLTWQARFEHVANPAYGNPRCLHLTVRVSVPQVCQRCLCPVDLAVAIDRSFRLVETEELASEQDAASTEDVLASSPAFDLAALIEDEVLMALPMVPRHEVCQVALPASVADADFAADDPARPHPFAGLSRLKA